MITVSKGVLKARMLEYFRKVEATQEELVVTDHHKPVLRVVPYARKKSVDEVFGPWRGKFRGKDEDILAPTTEEGEDA